MTGTMRGRKVLAATALALTLVGGASTGAGAATATGTSNNFQLVGHNNLFDRGVNAALAVYDHTVYVGSRSDGTHLHGGVQIVDVSDPSHPADTGEIAIPTELQTGYTSREMRVWPQQRLLMVVYFGCSAILHACVSGADLVGTLSPRIAFFDLTDQAHPAMISTYTPSVTPHELYLWVDPAHPTTRALLYWTSPNATAKQLVVTDISGWRAGHFPEVATMGTPVFGAAGTGFDTRLHSLSITPDGRRGFLAYLGGGVFDIDTSDLASGRPTPVIRLVTPVGGRAFWDNQGAHSTVPIPGTHYLLTTEEIYGKGAVLTDVFGPALGGCPWGWVRIVDNSDPSHLRVVSEYRADENQASFCAGVSPQQDNLSSYASHNPTVLPGLALITWHSAGLRAVDLCDPVHPATAGLFVPTPDTHTPGVHLQDPALEPGSNGTIAWSYPVVRNGLIYYIDIANGLYVVRYTGPHAATVAQTSFFEGNSNAGDAAAGTSCAQSGGGPAQSAVLPAVQSGPVSGAGGGSPDTAGGAPGAAVAASATSGALVLLTLGTVIRRRRSRGAAPITGA